jgi:hypothetical protein
MTSRRQNEEKAGIPSLVRETADSFVSLVAAHLKIANLELAADLHARTKQIGGLVAIGVVALVGYMLLMVGVALAASSWVGRPLAFVLLGALHVAVAAVAAVVVGMKRRQVPQVSQVIESVSQSVTSVADAVMTPSTPTRNLERVHARA